VDKTKLNKIRKANEKFIKRFKLEDDNVVKLGLMSENENIGKLEYLKTGIIPLDLVTGGLLKGKINVWFGPKDSCKSTCVRNTVANLQKNDPDFFAGYMNQEKSMDREYWEKGGVDFERVQALEFRTNEQALDYANLCASGDIPINLLAIDTLQALACEGELGTEDKARSMSNDTMALNAASPSRN